MTTDPTQLLGQLMKGYRLEELLGQGGMGCVYRAVHPRTQRAVAIKVLHSELQSQSHIERFFLEAKAVNAIRHDNVIDILDFDQTEQGEPFMIMELLDGQSLAQTIEFEAPLDEPRLCKIAMQICSALGAAHAQGFIHRDLKGDNVFLLKKNNQRDFVKILDFGIAKQLDQAIFHTKTGVMIGTPLCMSPEQAAGKKVDARSDVYSLGVLLFQMATRRAPFEHENALAVAAMHIRQMAPSPKEFNPRLSDALEGIILRCLQKNPDERFPSMEALSKALAPLVTVVTKTPLPHKSPTRPPLSRIKIPDHWQAQFPTVPVAIQAVSTQIYEPGQRRAKDLTPTAIHTKLPPLPEEKQEPAPKIEDKPPTPEAPNAAQPTKPPEEPASTVRLRAQKPKVKVEAPPKPPVPPNSLQLWPAFLVMIGLMVLSAWLVLRPPKEEPPPTKPKPPKTLPENP